MDSVISIKNRNALNSHLSTSDVSLQHQLVHFVAVDFRDWASRFAFYCFFMSSINDDSSEQLNTSAAAPEAATWAASAGLTPPGYRCSTADPPRKSMQGPEGLNVFAAVGLEEFDIPTDNWKKMVAPTEEPVSLPDGASFCPLGLVSVFLALKNLFL